MEISIGNLDSLQRAGRIKTGIGARRSSLFFEEGRGPLGIFTPSHLRILTNELNEERNNSIKQDLITSASTLYHRLIDKNDKTFNKAFFNGKYVEDEAYIENAALSYTLATSVKDVRTYWSADGQTGRPREKTGIWFGDVNNFDYNFDTVNRITKRMFKVEDGQFIAEQAFIDLKNPIEKADAYRKEFEHILNKTNLTEDQKKILSERLIFDTDAAEVYNVAFDFSPAWTNAQLIDKFNEGITVQDILDNYSTQFEQPNWYHFAQKRRIRQADIAAKSRS